MRDPIILEAQMPGDIPMTFIYKTLVLSFSHFHMFTQPFPS